MGPLTAWNYHDQLVASLWGRRDLEIKEFTGRIRYGAKAYPFTRVGSRHIAPGDRALLIRATFHGDETAGALTMLRRLPEIADIVCACGLKLICYPLANPSGFERGEPGGENGTRGYDDWVRYELKEGGIIDENLSNAPFTRRFMSSDPQLANLGVPVTLVQETALMHELVCNDLRLGAHIVAMLDIHQHCHVEIGEDPEKLGAPGAYFYGFGKRARRRRYNGIIARINNLVPVLRHTRILSGENTPMKTDGQGCIPNCHDGSYADFWDWRGAEVIVAETTGPTPLPAAEEVYLEWIRGLAELHKR